MTAKAKDGTTFSDEFTFGIGTGADSARDAIKQSLSAAGWNVANSGAQGLTITGHGASPISEVDGGIKVPGDTGVGHLNISEDGSGGVKRGEATVGEDYKFAFLQLDPGSPVLTSSGTVSADIDGTAVSAPVTSGDTPSQVALALAGALLSASIPINLTGNTISFILDAADEVVLSTDLSLDATGLEALIAIPSVPEPPALVIFSLATLAAYAARKRAHVH